MRLQTNFQTVGALYDFEADSSSGAVGTIKLGAFIPQYAGVIRLTYYALTAFTSGGAATISFGYTPLNTTSPDVTDAFAALTAIATLNANRNFSLTTPVQLTSTIGAVELTMTIAVDALTAGKGKIVVAYDEFNI